MKFGPHIKITSGSDLAREERLGDRPGQARESYRILRQRVLLEIQNLEAQGKGGEARLAESKLAEIDGTVASLAGSDWMTIFGRVKPLFDDVLGRA
jgi:hypothetical protein